MSSPTWTAAALRSETRRISGRCWRIVEAQHRVSTMKLVESLADQARLEAVLDRSKPLVPEPCRSLHYLLSTPFRRAGVTPGVFYASRTVRTALAETAFHRLLFFAESPETPWPANAWEATAFAVDVRTGTGLDLARPPFDAARARWTHVTDYEPCQRLAESARDAGVEIVRYPSARDPDGGTNLAVLTCAAFAAREPALPATWRLHASANGVGAVASFTGDRVWFARDAFATDPRIAALRWAR
jgi:hypothetical protein